MSRCHGQRPGFVLLAELPVAQVPGPSMALESEAEVGVMLLPATGQDGWKPRGAAGAERTLPIAPPDHGVPAAEAARRVPPCHIRAGGS